MFICSSCIIKVLFCWLDEICLITLICWIRFLTVLLGWESSCSAVAILQASDLRKNQDEMVFCEAEQKTRHTLQVSRTICYIKNRLNIVTENRYWLVSPSTPYINNNFCFYFYTEKTIKWTIEISLFSVAICSN